MALDAVAASVSVSECSSSATPNDVEGEACSISSVNAYRRPV